MLFLLLCLVGLLLAYMIVVTYYPSFGGDVTKTQKEKFEPLENFTNGKFINRKDVPEKLTLSKFLDIGYRYFTTKIENGTPKNQIEIVKINPQDLHGFNGSRVFWFGHSTFLIQHSGMNILIDPMFGKVPAPFDFLGAARFQEELPIAPENLPKIDYVVFSHDHYDHLDYESVVKLKDKVEWFLTPLGLGNHLMRWGVKQEQIIELNWWESKSFDNISFTSTPSQHFSGRKFSNVKNTLWSSWVIQSDALSLYFSGDSGYDVHFKEIGEKYGPFDLSLIECGQYNKLWSDVHMFPHQTAQAGVDLNSKVIFPIHWGTFKLAMHPWNEPAIEVLKEAKKKNLKVLIPRIGESIYLDSIPSENTVWWE